MTEAEMDELVKSLYPMPMAGPKDREAQQMRRIAAMRALKEADIKGYFNTPKDTDPVAHIDHTHPDWQDSSNLSLEELQDPAKWPPVAQRGEGPYKHYISATGLCWLVRMGTIGPAYEYANEANAVRGAEALNAAFAAGANWQKNRPVESEPIDEARIERIVERCGPIGTGLIGTNENHGEVIRKFMAQAIRYAIIHDGLRLSPSPVVIGGMSEDQIRLLQDDYEQLLEANTDHDVTMRLNMVAAFGAALRQHGHWRPTSVDAGGVSVEQIMEVVKDWVLASGEISDIIYHLLLEEKAMGATKYEAAPPSRLSKLLEQKEPQP